MIKFSKGHYFGIAILLALIGLLQVGLYLLNNQPSSDEITISSDDKTWLLQQNGIDSLKEVTQENAAKIYPFNPNFISDYNRIILANYLSKITGSCQMMV